MNGFPGYGAAHEETMRMFSRTLDEDQRRRDAAIEALKIGFGGMADVARVPGMSRRTLDTGIRELEQWREDDPDHPQRPSGDAKRVRRPGGGRPPITDRKPQLESTLHEVLETHSAGSPTDERVRWTDLKPLQLAHRLLERGFAISRNTAAALLDRTGFRRRGLRQELFTGVVDPTAREEPFRHIAALRRLARRRGIPVFSLDTKTKELLGTLNRPGQSYSSAPQTVLDHDVRHLADGVPVLHGVYDVRANVGFITLGTSRETSAFVCDASALAWTVLFRAMSPNATELVWLCDCGGANAARAALQGGPDRAGHTLGRAPAHRPRSALHLQVEPHRTSPVQPGRARPERRHSGQSRDGAAHGRADTHPNGLSVTARILDATYAIGRTCSDTFRDIKDRFMRHDRVNGQWNDLVDPNGFPY
jgi:hypothetical protein